MTTTELLELLADGDAHVLPPGPAGVAERSGFIEWVGAASIEAAASARPRWLPVARLTERGAREYALRAGRRMR